MKALRLGYEEVCELILCNTETFATIDMFQQTSQEHIYYKNIGTVRVVPNVKKAKRPRLVVVNDQGVVKDW